MSIGNWLGNVGSALMGGGGGGAAPNLDFGKITENWGGMNVGEAFQSPEFQKSLTDLIGNQGQGGMEGIFGNLGPLLQGMSAVGGFFNDRSQMDMTKDLMNQQMQMIQEEVARNKQSYNTQLEDRQRGRLSVVDSQGNPKTSTWHLPVDEYMAQHGMK